MKRYLVVAFIVALLPLPAAAQLAPQSPEAFNELVVGKTWRDPANPLVEATFPSPGRFELPPTVGGSGEYTYESTGQDTGALTLTFDQFQNDPDLSRVELELAFETTISGTYTLTQYSGEDVALALSGNFEVVAAVPALPPAALALLALALFVGYRRRLASTTA